jgi:putative phosphoribosyl transferase
MRFTNRQQAGRLLAAELDGRIDPAEALVLALPRGGVPVGYEVARALDLPLDVFLVRKLGVPGHEELAMGAVAEGGFRMLNREIVESAGVSAHELARIQQQQWSELVRQENLYRQGRPRRPVHSRTVVLVDDGLATGATMQVAAQSIRAQRPNAVWIAVPVAPPQAVRMLQRFADEVRCLYTPQAFASVGSWYDDFAQVTDEQVMELLNRAVAESSGPDPST